MKTSLLALVAALAAASVSHAAVLVSFNMTTITGTGATKGFAPATLDSGITSTNLLKNNLLSTSPTNIVLYSGNAAGTWTTTVAQSSINVATTLTNANYITFTVTPISGNSVTIDSISFGAAASSNSTVRSIYLLSGATGFDSSHVLLSDANALGGGTLPIRSSGALKSYSLTLTDPAFSGITVATEFRIYLQTGSINQDIDFDNITLNGSSSPIAAVPEPSSYALAAACGALGFVAFRRRR